MRAITDLTPESFADTITKEPGFWLVDFWSEWCMPCQAYEPVLAEFATQAEGVHLARLNIADYPESAERYDVTSVPTVVIFRDGEPVSRLFGPKNHRQLQAALDRLRAS
jgi:thioredoxin 1